MTPETPAQPPAAPENEVSAPRGARAAGRPWAQCTGAGDCPESWHIHGCFADRGQCDDPTDHADQHGEREQRARAESAEAAHEALRKGIEALADEWERAQGRHEIQGERWMSPHVKSLRALLTTEAR